MNVGGKKRDEGCRGVGGEPRRSLPIFLGNLVGDGRGRFHEIFVDLKGNEKRRRGREVSITEEKGWK